MRHRERVIEERLGFAGARRRVRGLSGPSTPPMDWITT
jgi:hypothetical protein